MIKSESQFIWKFILKILLLPFTFLQVLFGKKQLRDLWEPINMVWEFIQQAKVTFTLIILNIIIFFILIFMPEEIFALFASFPTDLFSVRAYTLITSGFLHASLSHLLWNMLALFIFGRIVERELGSKKMFWVYMGSLVISNIFSSLTSIFILQNNIPGVGASGAIAGLIATAVLLDPLEITYIFLIPLPAMLVGWSYMFLDISGILSGVQDNVGRFAHLGGYISISIILFFLERHNREKIKRGFLINIASIVIVSILIAIFGIPQI